jgi:hypothetical protein
MIFWSFLIGTTRPYSDILLCLILKSVNLMPPIKTLGFFGLFFFGEVACLLVGLGSEIRALCLQSRLSAA